MYKKPSFEQSSHNEVVTLSVVEGSEYLEVLFNRTQVYRPFDYAQGDIYILGELRSDTGFYTLICVTTYNK